LITASNIIPNTPNNPNTTDITTDTNLIKVNTFANTSPPTSLNTFTHNNSYGISINNGNPIMNFLNNNLISNITKVNNNNNN